MQKSATAHARESLAAAASNFGRDLVSGSIVSVVSLAYSLSFALLIFSGSLAPGLPYGISAALLSAGLCTLVISLGSSFVRAVGGPDSAPIAIMAVLAATVASHVAAPDALLPTVLTALVTASFASGMFLLGLGAFRLEAWMRYIPYPVLAGFVAAVGWQLMLGGLRVLTGGPVTLDSIELLAQPQTVYHLLAGLAFVLTAAGAQYVSRSPPALAGVLIGAVAVAHVVFLSLGMDLDQARAGFWLLAVPDTPNLFLPWQHTSGVDWLAVANGGGEIAACAAIVAVNVLLNGTSLELWSRRGLDLNRELVVNAAANIFAGAVGGLPGNLSFNRTILNTRSGATGRRSALICGAILIGFVAVGPGLMGLVPTPVLGGLLIYLGLNVLRETLARVRHTLGPADYVLLALLFLLIVNWGYFEGVALGVVASCIVFVFRYSRVPIVRHDLTRASFGSTLDRTQRQSDLLREAGAEMQILWLRGYLFFGTANRLYAAIEKRGKDPLHHLVLDFSRVSGMDSSAVFSFVKLAHLAREREITVAFCALSREALNTFRGEGLLHSGDRHVRSFATLDQGLEWSEEQMLAAHLKGSDRADVPIETWLTHELEDSDLTKRFLAILDLMSLDKDAVLFRQGDAADALYLIKSGKLAITLKADDGTTVRLRTMATHTVLGEMGLYRDLQRTATVVALEPSQVLRLSKARFLDLKRDDPELCDAVHRMVVRTLANRLAFANSAVAALQ